MLLAGLRGGGLALRLALTLYIAQYLGLAALGVYGLIAGAAAALPPFFNLGLSYFLNREMIGLPRIEAYVRMRDRLLITAVLTGLAAVVAIASLAAVGTPVAGDLWLVVPIVACETLMADLHLPLVNRGHALLANVAFFLRSAAWTVPVMLMGLADPVWRRLDIVLVAWAVALLLALLLVAVALRRGPWPAALARPVDRRWLAITLPRAPLFYLNDIALMAQVWLDRFLVAGLLGPAAAGRYTLVASLANGVFVLTHAAVVQLALRRLHEARAAGGSAAWRAVLRRESLRALGCAAMLAGAAVLTVLLVLPLLGFDAFLATPVLLLLMVAAAVIRPAADLLVVGLYSAQRDRSVAILNLGAAVLGGLLCLTGLQLMGLVGAGVATLLLFAGLGGTALRLLQRNKHGLHDGAPSSL